MRAITDGGWDKIGLDEALGGMPMPRAVQWALMEHVLGANPAVYMYSMGAGFAEIMYHLGTEEQKKWAVLAAERGWTSTMVLTEPDAGSDVGAGRTKAVKQADGSWHIDGVKRFITSGDSDDLGENILHLVLARPEGAGPGTKGLSLFFVPKFHFDPETGEPGERNGVFVTNVEHKMGLKVSATCELSLGQHGVPASGWLVGEVHEGIAQMFDVIEHARMMVGTKAIATLSTGYLNALEYAKDTRPGRRPDPDDRQDRAARDHHAPPRRASLADDPEGLRRGPARAVPVHRDVPGRAQWPRPCTTSTPSWRSRSTTCCCPSSRASAPSRPTPSSPRACRPSVAPASCRTTRSSSTSATPRSTRSTRAPPPSRRRTSSSARSCATRVWRWRYVAGQIEQFVKNEAGNGRLKAERALLATALEDVQGMAATLTGYLMSAQEDPKNIYKVGLGSVRFLMSVGDLVIGWLLQKQAAVAIAALDAGASGDDRAFYEGKIAVGVVLREELPAAAHQHPSGDRHPRQRGHGTGRGGLLGLLSRFDQKAPGTLPGGLLRRRSRRLCVVRSESDAASTTVGRQSDG